MVQFVILLMLLELSFETLKVLLLRVLLSTTTPLLSSWPKLWPSTTVFSWLFKTTSLIFTSKSTTCSLLMPLRAVGPRHGRCVTFLRIFISSSTSFTTWDIRNVYREANKATDWIANVGYLVNSVFLIDDCTSFELSNFLVNDKVGAPLVWRFS